MPRPNMGGPPSGAPPSPPLSAPGKSAQPACESDFTFLGVDPGEGNCVTVAGIACTGFGNRLGRGPRKPPKPQRMQSKQGRRSRRSNGARRRKEPPVATHVFRLGEYDAACGRALSARFRRRKRTTIDTAAPTLSAAPAGRARVWEGRDA